MSERGIPSEQIDREPRICAWCMKPITNKWTAYGPGGDLMHGDCAEEAHK